MESKDQQRIEQAKRTILVIVGLLTVVGVALTLNRIERVRLKSDLFLRWYASVKLVEEERNIYDPANADEVRGLLQGDYDPTRTTNYFYPAPLLMFTAPLALLSFPQAHFLWTILVQLFYLAGLWLLMRLLGWPPSANQTAVFLGAAYLLLPHLQHVLWAQFNTIGVLSLLLCYVSLYHGRYGLAGVWASGLLFKPQSALLSLGFLLLWALFARERWRFLVAFAFGGLGLWLVAEWMQPGWLFDFQASLDYYIPVQSVLDQIWNPGQVAAIILGLGTLSLLWWRRKATAVSVCFAGCLALTLAVWALVVPIVGMMHIVFQPIGVILILAGLRQIKPRLYAPAGYTFIGLYMLGWLGFVTGLAGLVPVDPILWGELIYKIILPLSLVLFSLPLVRANPQARLVIRPEAQEVVLS